MDGFIISLRSLFVNIFWILIVNKFNFILFLANFLNSFYVIVVSRHFNRYIYVSAKLFKVYAPASDAPINKSELGILVSDDFALYNYEIKREGMEGVP